MKRIFALLVLMATLLTVLPVMSATAADTLTFAVENVTASKGTTVEVDVTVSNNPGIVSFKLVVSYDEDVLELVSAKDAAFTGMNYSETTSNPFAINWVDTLNPNNTTNGTVSTLTFRVKDTAKLGKTDIKLSYDYLDDFYDYDFNNVEFDVVDGSVTVTESKVSVEAVGDIDYSVSGQVVTVNHKIACKVGYLVDGAYVAIAAVANGNGTYSFTAPAGVTEVLLVVKGDANGDAIVNIVDKMTVAKSLLLTTHAAYQALDSIQQFACDTDSNSSVNMVDKMTIAKSLLLPTHPAYQAIKW